MSGSNITVGMVGHLYAGSGSNGYFIALALYWVLWLTGLALFLRYRKFQPLRARDTTMVAICTLFSIFPVTVFLVRAELGDTSVTCWLSWVAANLVGPLYVLPFELGALGLVYLYEWNLEKLSRAKGFWQRHSNLFFSSWFRLLVISIFLVTQLALSAIIQHSEFTMGNQCVLLQPAASIPFFVIYAALFVFILYKLSRIEDLFDMKREYIAVFLTVIILLPTWYILSVLQTNNALTGEVFTQIFAVLTMCICNTIVQFFPLYLLTREPWRSVKRTYERRSTSESDDGLNILSLGLSSLSENSVAPDIGASAEERMAIDAINIARLQNLNLDDPSNPAPLKAYLMDPIFCESFKRFCVKSFCVESVLFYLDARDSIFQAALRSSSEKEAMVKLLMEHYIYENSDLEVNISYQVREQIVEEFKATRDDPRIFRMAISEVYYTLRNSIFISWLDSVEFARVRAVRTSPETLVKRRSQAAFHLDHHHSNSERGLGLNNLHSNSTSNTNTPTSPRLGGANSLSVASLPPPTESPYVSDVKTVAGGALGLYGNTPPPLYSSPVSLAIDSPRSPLSVDHSHVV